MFWKNNYTYNDTMTDYLTNKERTNFTYAERTASEKTICDEPYLTRRSIHTDLAVPETEITNANSTTEMLLRKSVTTRVSSDAARTPVSRKSFSTDSDRVLRSRPHRKFRYNSIVPFVIENDASLESETVQNQFYRIGSLNTNTNNSGPDQLESKTKKKPYNYDLFGDEDMGSDIENKIAFGSNNANKAVGTNKEVTTSTQWLHRNIFGLPNEESDEVSHDLSGAISGDEQYDIAPYQKGGLNHRLKSSGTVTRKSSRADRHSHKTLDNISCSPGAMLTFIVEWIWQVVRTVTTGVARMTIYHSPFVSWLIMPFRLIGRLADNIAAILAYSIDRLFGTSLLRRINKQSRTKRALFTDLLYKTISLLLFIFAIWGLLHLLFADFMKTSSETQLTTFFDFNLTRYAYEMVGNDCMTANDCCRTYSAVIRRFSFCLFSLPARMILPGKEQLSTNIIFSDSLHLSPANVSQLTEILSQINSKLEDHSKQLSGLGTKIKNMEKDSKTKTQSDHTSDQKVSELSKNIESISTKLQKGLQQLQILEINVEKSKEKLSEDQKGSISSVSSNLETFKMKVEENVKITNNMVDEVQKRSMAISNSTNKLEISFNQLRTDINNFQAKLNEINDKTVSLEQSNKGIIDNSEILKKDIMNRVDEKLGQHQSTQHNIDEKLNEQMSKLERAMEENQRKSLDQEYLKELVETALLNIRTEINSTILHNFANHVVTQSTDIHHDQFKGANIFSSDNARKLCSCLPSRCRCPRIPMSCIRVHEVRKLLNETLARFAADKIGLADFALESAGGTIATTRCTETYTDRASTLTVFGIPLMRLTNSPRTIIQPSMNPGECWPMKGSRGAIVVQLSARIKVEAVSIDHIPKSLSPSESIDSAIQEFEIKALNDESDKIGVSLGNFTYSIDSDPVQTFKIQDPVETKFVELIVNSNYGNKEYTCIYRFRVHGKLIGA